MPGHHDRGSGRPIQDVDDPVQDVLDPAELVLGDLDGAGNVEQADGPLGGPPHQHLHDFLEPPRAPKHAESRLVRGMLPRGGTDARKLLRPAHQGHRRIIASAGRGNKVGVESGCCQITRGSDTIVPMAKLDIRAESLCRHDFLSLGSLVQRFDPGLVPLHEASRFDRYCSGAEYNPAANLAKCFHMRAAVTSAMVQYPPAGGSRRRFERPA